ncbi:unnamed protein product [Schistosoma spindalis]|nr:unnamed protein product [Schistosoma spindale]
MIFFYGKFPSICLFHGAGSWLIKRFMIFYIQNHNHSLTFLFCSFIFFAIAHFNCLCIHPLMFSIMDLLF